MSVLEDFIYRILCCVVLYSILSSLFPEGQIKRQLQIIFGIFLTVILLSSAVDYELPDFEGVMEDFLQQAQTASAAGEAYALQQRHNIIKETLEAYILDKADAYGCNLSVSIEVNDDGYPACVYLWGDIPSDKQRKMESMLSQELGIAKEDQQWNGLHMENHSAVP